jgi:hypothetical protein
MRKPSRKKPGRTVSALPPTNSAATMFGAWSPVLPLPPQPPRKRKGPAPGTVGRNRKDDRALYPELKRMMDNDHLSLTAAARKLAEDGRVGGYGIPESRARRLAKLYKADSLKAPLADER